MADAIRGWLDGLGLAKYVDLFAENEIDLDAARYLTDDDLKELGLPLGPRKKLLAAIGGLGDVPPVAQRSESAVPQGAERRQLTVLFCDLVGSTALSGRLDPEDMRDVLRRYQDAVAGVVSRHDGYVANYLGDGVLAYFGWPKADEDQAAQAVRAGLAAVRAVTDIVVPGGERLAARAGIASGQVVVGDLEGETARQIGAVSGETPNLAARLQALAEPGQVVIAGQTRDLVGRQFDLADLGPQDLKGIAGPAQAWRVEGESAVDSRFAARGAEMVGFVGREHELGLLLDRWRLAGQGEGQVVLLSGEAGIGKSRLTEELRQHVGREGALRLSYQCAPQYANSAFWPVIRQLQRAAGFQPDDATGAQLDKLEALVGGDRDVASLLSALLSLPGEERYGALELSPEARKQRTIQALVGQLLALAADRPVLLLFEDAHWIDPSTLELLVETVARITDGRVLMVVTTRPEWTPPWTGQPHASTLHLTRLGRGQAADIVAAIAGPQVGAEAIERIVARTDGIPLFVEELTKALVERGLDAADADIPATLQASLAARLDRLDPVAKEVAQIGAVIGREFDHDLLAAVVARGAQALDDALGRLLESQLVLRTGHGTQARYSFKHALVQDAAYDGLLRRRRQELHLRVIDALLGLSPQTEATQPELLAHHYQAGGDFESAIRYWSQAGDVAEGRSAAVEAIAHYRGAIDLLVQGEETVERLDDEQRLNLRLGNAFMQAYGYASAEARQALDHARHLAIRSGKSAEQIFSMSPVYLAQGRYHEIIAMAQTERPGQDGGLGGVDFIHHNTMAGVASLLLGDLDAAWKQNSAALALNETVNCGLEHPIGGADPAVTTRSYGAWIRHMQGYPDHARALVEQALLTVQTYDHAFSTAWAHLAAIRGAFFSRRFEELVSRTAFLRELAEQHGFIARVGNAMCYHGHAVAMLGDAHAGVGEMLEGLRLWEANGGVFHMSQWSIEAALTALQVGCRDEAVALAERAAAILKQTGEVVAESEISRFRGRLSLADGDAETAESCFVEAIDVASGRGNLAYALAAAIDLARLLGDGGDRTRAAAALRPVYDRYTEGFDTADVVEARALLDELGG